MTMIRRCSLFVFALLLLIGIFTNAYADIPVHEREALIALYKSTDGDHWTNNSGWKTPPLYTDGFAKPGSEADWYGVWVVDNSTVVSITTHHNQLNGTIPSQLGNLSNLAVLDISSNQLTGAIPSELGNLTNLEFLDLSSNQLTGTIPQELGNLTNLSSRLSLQSNQLSGSIPPELGNLENLQDLHLYSNQLSGSIPPELGNLENLQQLSLCDNQLSGGIPKELGDLLNLQVLHLKLNQLTGTIPQELGNLSNLQYVYLASNKLCGPLPVELMKLTSLLDNQSEFCDNYLYTDDPDLRDFLNTKGISVDWESCQRSLDISDISSFASAYGSINLDNKYDTYYDFDDNADIDGNDLAKFATLYKRFGDIL